MSGNIIFNYSVSDMSSVLISDVSLFPSLNQEMWTDSPGGWWRLPVPRDHSIGASWWRRLHAFNESRGTPSPRLHPVSLQEETMWQRVSRTARWMILVTFDNISSIQQDFPCDFCFPSSVEIHMSSPYVQCLCPLILPLKGITEEKFCVLDSPYWRPKTTCRW